MVKIVNGVIQGSGPSSSSASFSSSPSTSSSSPTSMIPERINVCGYQVPGYAAVGGVLTLTFLFGLKVLLLSALIYGISYFYSLDSTSSSLATSASGISRGGGGGGGGGGPRIVGMKDLPKPPAKC